MDTVELELAPKQVIILTSMSRISKRLSVDRWVRLSRRFWGHFQPPPGRLSAKSGWLGKYIKAMN